jgi:hypothetical protein
VRTHRYRITISGALGELGREAFGDFRTESNGTNTTLTGDLDQAALYGALNRILTLGFELLEFTRLADGRRGSPERRDSPAAEELLGS